MAVSSVEPIRYSFDIEGMYKYTSCFQNSVFEIIFFCDFFGFFSLRYGECDKSLDKCRE